VDTPISTKRPFVLTASCAQAPGIMQAVTTFLFERNFDIFEHQQFDDAYLDTFHLRTAFNPTAGQVDLAKLEQEFAPIAERLGMKFQFHDPAPMRIVALVSKDGRCLNDLLFRWRAGSLGGELVAVASNHESLRAMVEAAELPFVHIPMTAATQQSSEVAYRSFVEEFKADLVVLARFMQIFSDDFARDYENRVINIHHSFLPGFKGGRPYHQAYDRGVKLVGATAHYVTADLDEGPIIEQEVVRVNHSFDPTAMATIGRDIESSVLSRAVKWHAEHRVLTDHNRTIVFN
jgi:formyltetrahydrofolate deformylase